jgi:hypothetical protein
VTQDTAAGRDFQQGNALHALTVARDGTLSESNPPVTFSASEVPAAARLQGVAVVARTGRAGSARGHRKQDGGGVAPFAHPTFGTTGIDGRDVSPASVRSTLLGARDRRDVR